MAQWEARLRQNSHNSSNPPSSDPLYQAKRMLDMERSRKKAGGQPGHEKHEQKVIPTDQVRQVIPKHCQDCQFPLGGKNAEPSFHQHIEIPVIQPEVTHFHVYQLTCSRCGTVTKGQVPAGNRSSYGPRLEALVSHLTGGYRFSKRKAVGLLEEVLGIPMSLGMVCKLQVRTTRALEAGMVEIDDKIMNSAEPKNVDETGQRVCGKLAYAWVASSPSAVKFGIGPRSRLSFDKLVGKPLGVISSDRYPVYSHLGVGFRQLCWSHLIRDFFSASEEKNETGEIGKRLFKTGIQILRIWQRVRDGTLSRSDFIKNYLGRYQKRIRADLELAGAYPKRKLGIVAKNLLERFDSLWQFAHVEGVEPTNNEAKRQLRELVIYRKICLFIQSETGRRFIETIFSVIATKKYSVIATKKYSVIATKKYSV